MRLSLGAAVLLSLVYRDGHSTRRRYGVEMIKSLLIGLALSVAAVFVSLFTMGAGHGTNVPASILLPWSMLLAYAQFDSGVVLLSSLIQFPLYAVLVRRKRVLALPLAIIHFGAVAGALARSAA